MKIKKLLKKAVAVLIAFAACAGLSGCTGKIGENAPIESVSNNENNVAGAVRAYLPVKREDGRKFKMAFVDIDPYNETFRMMYYVIESLKADGWLTYDSLPYDPNTDSDTLEMMNWLADNAESEYMTFDKEVHFYTTVNTEEEIYDTLKKHIEVIKDVDLVLTLGTSPAQMIQKYDFDIPLLMYAVSDPIGSGLIKSAEDSGDSRYWAHVDSSAYARQMQYYYDTFQFTNIGSVYGDAIISGLPEYREIAEKNGFTITEYQVDRESMEENEYYKELGAIYRKMINEDGVDAYILNTNVIPSTEKAREMMQVFYDANIPVFAQVGSAYVSDGGALMIVDPRDASGTSPFVSNIIGSVFNGSEPGDLEQEYVSSPYLTLNLDVADEIEFRPSFEMLIACEKIICSE
ncbi:MAG: ABC transporter substrate binding protein [Oscillospiraceae bacterium]